MNQEELQQKVKQLEKVYQNFLKELGKIRKEQDDILEEYASSLDVFKVKKT